MRGISMKPPRVSPTKGRKVTREELEELWPLPVGTKIRIVYGENNLNNVIYHVRGVVDDQLVIRHWRERKQWWEYRAEGLYYFTIRCDSCMTIELPKEEAMTLPMKKKREGARLPKRQTKGASGYDLHACVTDREAHELIHRCPCHGRDPFCRQCLGHGVATDGEYLVIFPGELRAVPLGLSMQIPEGYEMQIRGRSHYNEQKVIVPIATIDSDYRGEVWVQMLNLSQESMIIKDGDRIAQGIFASTERVEPEWADELTDTERGERGFGSTGRR